MVARVVTVAFDGVEARRVDVEVQLIGNDGPTIFNIVGLPDKAVAESKERVRGAFAGIGLALPAKRIIANLAPADLPKEGSHYDLPIALGLMAAIGAIPHDALPGFTVLGELGLDGSIAAVAGALPAAIGANSRNEGLICPQACGPEAAWASLEMEIVAASSLIQLANHFKGTQVLGRPKPGIKAETQGTLLDLADILADAPEGSRVYCCGPEPLLAALEGACAERELPTIQGAYLLHDAETLSPLAMIDGTALTAVRTPAVSALGVDLLADGEARELIVFGTGLAFGASIGFF